MRTPTWRELQRFCEVEGWYDRDARRGRPTGDHYRYGFDLPTGEVLTTKVSHGKGQISPDLFKRILRDQPVLVNRSSGRPSTIASGQCVRPPQRRRRGTACPRVSWSP